MDKSEEIGELAAAVAAVMSEAQQVGKTGDNRHGGYSYASDADLKRVLQPSMAAHGLALLPVSVERQDGRVESRKGNTMIRAVLTVRYLLAHKSGQWVQIIAVGEGIDSQDKAYYKAQTGAEKYALRVAFHVPTGDDGDAVNPVEGGLAPHPVVISQQEELNRWWSRVDATGVDRDALLDWLDAESRSRPEAMTPGKRAAAIEWLERDGASKVMQWAEARDEARAAKAQEA